MSASLWGCELKYFIFFHNALLSTVSLLVRLWVEMFHSRYFWWSSGSQPPCEAVSWNKPSVDTVKWWKSQPPCEAVSWNSDRIQLLLAVYVSLLVRLWVEICDDSGWVWSRDRQPPCEAVSWNFHSSAEHLPEHSQPPCEAVSWNVRILRVAAQHLSSASLWGCELKYKMCYRVTNEELVSLLVRLWVEIACL